MVDQERMTTQEITVSVQKNAGPLGQIQSHLYIGDEIVAQFESIEGTVRFTPDETEVNTDDGTIAKEKPNGYEVYLGSRLIGFRIEQHHDE